LNNIAKFALVILVAVVISVGLGKATSPAPVETKGTTNFDAVKATTFTGAVTGNVTGNVVATTVTGATLTGNHVGNVSATVVAGVTGNLTTVNSTTENVTTGNIVTANLGNAVVTGTINLANGSLANDDLAAPNSYFAMPFHYPSVGAAATPTDALIGAQMPFTATLTEVEAWAQTATGVAVVQVYANLTPVTSVPITLTSGTPVAVAPSLATIPDNAIITIGMGTEASTGALTNTEILLTFKKAHTP
jgi:hypothetical protein